MRFPVLRDGFFATSKNLYNITRNTTFVAIIALGMTLVIITGGIDLSVGSVLCLCSMVLAVVMHAGYSIEVGIAASVATALLIGAFNGILIAYLGFPPFVVTLGMLSIARSLAMVASNNTVVFQFGPDHDKLLALGGGAWLFGIANPVIYMIVLALLTGFVLRWTRLGRYIYAIGGNEHAATATGIPVRPIKVGVYMISALSAGVAGIIQTGWLGAVTTNIGAGMELQVIAATVIGGANLAGGTGTALGALVGAALIEVIRNSLGCSASTHSGRERSSAARPSSRSSSTASAIFGSLNSSPIPSKRGRCTRCFPGPHFRLPYSSCWRAELAL